MKTVYILKNYFEYEGFNIIAVYQTKEAAEDKLKELHRVVNIQYNGLTSVISTNLFWMNDHLREQFDAELGQSCGDFVAVKEYRIAD